MKGRFTAAALLTALAGQAASAATIKIFEPNDGPPTFVTDLTNVTSTVAPESLFVSGFHDPSISIQPLQPGVLFALLLLEPGGLPGTETISDLVLIQAGDIIQTPVGSQQQLDIHFLSDTETAPIQVPANAQIMGRVIEDGTLQEIPWQFSNPPGLSVFVMSDVEASVPLPASAIMGLGLLGGMMVARRFGRK